MDNSNEIFQNKNINININLSKHKFIKQMKGKHIDIKQFLTNNQFDKLFHQLFNEDSDIILDNSIKESEIDKILSEQEDLNSLLIFLKSKLRKQIRDDLKKDNGYTKSIRTMKPLSIMNENLKDPILNSYIQKLINSDHIDFSLFYFGNIKDIFNEVYNSFITSKNLNGKNICCIKYDTKMTDTLFIELSSMGYLIIKKSNDETLDIINNLDTNKLTTGDEYFIYINKIELKNPKYDNIYQIYCKYQLKNNYKTIIDKFLYDLNNEKYQDIICLDTNNLSKTYFEIIQTLYQDIDKKRFIYQRYKVNNENNLKLSLSFIEICEYLNELDDIMFEKEKNNFIKEIQKNFVEYYKEIFQIYYLNYLNFNYWDKRKNIYIKSNHFKEHTLNKIAEYLEMIKSILIDILSNNKIKEFLNSNNSMDYFTKKLDKEEFVSGFLLSTLYNFNKSLKHNIPMKYLQNNEHWHNHSQFSPKKRTSDKISDDDINKCIFYFDININKVIYIKNNQEMKNYINNIAKYKLQSEKDKIRLILTKKQLTNLQQHYNNYFKSVVLIVQKLIQKYEISQKKYLYILDLFITYDKKYYEYNKELKIKQEFTKFLKSKNLQTDTDIIITSKIYFSSIIYDLNEKLLKLLEDKTNTTSLIDKYNRFIIEYSLWVIYIIKYISTYPNNSKQIIYFDKIRQMFISDKDIKKWYNNCVKNNLHYWLPISYTGKVSYSFFLNLITNKKSYTIKPNNLIIIKYKNNNLKNFEDEINCWNNNHFNILIDEPYEVILTFIKQYVKCNKSIDMNDFNVIKSLVNRCDKKTSNYNKIIKEKENLIKKFNTSISDEIEELNNKIALSDEIEHDCKNLISYHQIIKEIIKTKYPFNINDNNNLDQLNNTVRKYQTKLYNQIPK